MVYIYKYYIISFIYAKMIPLTHAHTVFFTYFFAILFVL